MAAKHNDDVYVNDLYRCQKVREPEFSQFMSHLSNGLYFLACDIIGDEDTIRIRRHMTKLQNYFNDVSSIIEDCKLSSHISGSRSEGFEFSSSDVDYMIIYRHIKVVHSITSQVLSDINHDFNDTTYLLMEYDKARPGFALFRLIGEAYEPDVHRSCMEYLSGIYVSSQIWRDENPYIHQKDFIHGPCNSGVIGATEYDQAHCLHSSTWPTAADGCIDRLRERQWPPFEVVKDIVNGGVHFVPICSKESQFGFLEWRVSFSSAETNLIHSMNHTQFICYGLLKIFLKEAINNIKEIESILCSYYLKTAVFWEILNPLTVWVPQELFKCFWQCFSRLISWIRDEYLPNFFIPENNMLVGKLQSGQKKMLIDHLNMLYSEGYSCLLRCPSLRDLLTDVIHRPHIAYIEFSCIHKLQKSRNALVCILSMWNIRLHDRSLDMSLLSLETLEYLLHTSNCDSDAEVLSILGRRHIAKIVTMYYITLTESFPHKNKEHYYTYRKVLATINQCRVDCVSHLLYIAVCLYRNERYEDVIKIYHIAKTKLQNPYLMYFYTYDRIKYKAAGGDYTPYQVMLRKNIAYDICLRSISCIPELRLEHQVVAEDASDLLTFPPVVIAELLQCLSCYHLGYHHLVQEAVNDLYMLVHYDDGYHISDADRALSWQILGICQEMIRDYQGAYQSYYNALHYQYSDIRPASQRRLENLRQNTENYY